MAYLRNMSAPIQTQPLDAHQVQNSSGGYSYPVDDWTRLQRFLILGSEGGSYYASERQLSRENIDGVLRCIATDGKRTVDSIVTVSQSGRAPKNDPAIYCLALCASKGDAETREYALYNLSLVCRIGTHILHFAGYVDGLRGWGRGLRTAIRHWYTDRDPDSLAYQMVKYRSRDKWSHRDLLRLAHPKSVAHDPVFKWVTKGDAENAPSLIRAFEEAQTAESRSQIMGLIRDYGLPWEAVPDKWLGYPDVWDALLDQIGYTALIRSLSRLTRIEYIKPLSAGLKRVVDKIGDAEAIKRGRVHPVQILTAMLSYQHGVSKGGLTWQPVQQIVDALNDAFYASFGFVEPTGKRTLLALDVSGSMSGGMVAGVEGLTPRVAAAALSMVTARTETDYHIMAFSDTFVPLNISPRQRLDDVVNATSNLPFGDTDCALPMLWAMQNKIEIDTFAIYTDSETWDGEIHPMEALRRYRQTTGIAAKLVVVGMVSNGFTIADPLDAGALDIVGFDTATPGLISDFAREDLRSL